MLYISVAIQSYSWLLIIPCVGLRGEMGADRQEKLAKAMSKSAYRRLDAVFPAGHQCQLQMIAGGVNPLKGNYTFCGGTEPPEPPAMTVREAARSFFHKVSGVVSLG